MTEKDFWKKIGGAVVARPCNECHAYSECTYDMSCGETVKAMYESVAGAHSTDDKNAVEGTQEHERAVLPIPCTRGFEDWTVKQWFQKINEELDELKDAILTPVDLEWKQDGDRFCTGDAEHIADEAADTITAITSMLEAMGIDENTRQEAQKRVNKRNKEKGRL